FFKFASSLIYEIEQQQHLLKQQIRIIDFNPTAIQALRQKGYDAQYGDIAHIETLHHLGIHNAQVVISTVPDSLLKGTSNMNILKAVQQHAPKAKVIVISEDITYAVQLYNAGADYVLIPRLRVAQQLLEVIEKSFDWTQPGSSTESYKELQARKEILG
ncbi:MAG: NAD-binding protein, partial [Candidatus Thermochlorobacter sp.]